jgi:hypothetical protein
VAIGVLPAATDLGSAVAALARRVNERAAGFPQVYRLQFRVQTSSNRGADTDNWVRVSLNPNVWTYLDLPGDDFERGATRTYDLMLTDNDFNNAIEGLDDIQFFRIEKEKDAHDWAIVHFELLVNGRVVYAERFKDRRWLGSYEVSGETLRASADWREWKFELPEQFLITRAELEERVAAYVGHYFHESAKLKGIKWGDNGQGVRISRVADDSLTVHLDLLKVVKYLPNPDGNVDVNLRFIQLEDRLEVRIVSDPRLSKDGPVADMLGALSPSKVRNAREQIHQALLPRFELDDKAFRRLRRAGMPEDVVERLRTLENEVMRSRHLLADRLRSVLDPMQVQLYERQIASLAVCDPKLLLSIPFPSVRGLGRRPVYFHVGESGDVELRFGRDPMAQIRADEVRALRERREVADQRRSEWRRRRNELEP